jgi:hypothetical protein
MPAENAIVPARIEYASILSDKRTDVKSNCKIRSLSESRIGEDLLDLTVLGVSLKQVHAPVLLFKPARSAYQEQEIKQILANP